MRFWHLLIAVVPALAAPAVPALPPCDIQNTFVAPAPSTDSWYTEPAGYRHVAPGTILKIRCAGNLTATMGNASASYHIMYRTTDARYNASWAVTTLFVPQRPTLNNTSLLSYQIPYNTINIDASPSWTMFTNPDQNIVDALGRGWYVNSADWEGPLAANVAGIQAGHATLDSIKAAKAAGAGVASNSKVVLWGYSGGSIASEWALEFQEQYAPDLKIDGAALGGLVSNNTACIELVQGTPLAYIAVGAMIGPLIQYPEAYDRLVAGMKTEGPYNKTGFLAAYHVPQNQGFYTYYNQTIYDYFTEGERILHDPLIRSVLLRNQFMTYHGVPQAPLFIYKAIADEATSIEDTDYYVERNCMLLTNILYERNTVGGHLDEIINGVPRAIAWITSVFDGTYAGKYQASGCTIRNVSVGIDYPSPFSAYERSG